MLESGIAISLTHYHEGESSQDKSLLSRLVCDQHFSQFSKNHTVTHEHR